jgi:hypothetical protein
LNNNALWYDNDLILTPGSDFRLNGRVFTNGNLLVGGQSAKITLFQVSSKYSCFYLKENAQINVGGNVGTNDPSKDTDNDPVEVHLYKGIGNDPANQGTNNANETISGSTRSTSSAGGKDIAYNDLAYAERIALMKNTAYSFCGTNCANKTAAQIKVIPQYNDPDLQSSLTDAFNSNPTESPAKVLEDQIEEYLRQRTRRVPFKEVPAADATGALDTYDTDGDGIDTSVFTAGIEPPAAWREPTDANTKLSLISTRLPQSNPDTVKEVENLIGDRINVGNGLPARWKKGTTYVGQNEEPQEYTDGTQWTAGGSPRYRISQIQQLEDLGATARGEFWERAAAVSPLVTTGGGGLRIITGAGIYVDGNQGDPTALYPRLDPTAANASKTSFLPAPDWDPQYVDKTGSDPARLDPVGTDTNTANDIPKFSSQDPIVVWPDLMPMSSKGSIDGTTTPENRKGDLLMRATAVYHYVDAANAGNAAPKTAPKQEPIACVSSYYDPTNERTARNLRGLPDVSGGIDTDGNGTIDQLYGGGTPGYRTGANSNNGVVYNFPGRNRRFAYSARLKQQARLVFPDGTPVNPALREAMSKLPNKYTFADYSAIDTAICAISILERPFAGINGSVIPHGAIKESTFLDAREVKALDRLPLNDPNYDLNKNMDLPLEQRQPYEIRVTDINMGLLAGKDHLTFDANADGTPDTEYLLPNSGIIYATRDDAVSDNSNIYIKDATGTTTTVDLTQADVNRSAADFKLDPRRRPNGIRVINGLRLARGTGNTYNDVEKGLILVTNLPTYVKGHLNPHVESPKTGTSFTQDELEEFTQAVDKTNWSNFYNRGNASGGGLETRFACRQGQPLCTGNGDQWRPATIIADSITLQSINYQDGYRSQGDFDLNNNGGTNSGSASVQEGFFDNSFVPSANWYVGTGGTPRADFKVSYLVNGVTPIQQRVNNYLAFATESCAKLPVTRCSGADWVVDNRNTAQPSLPAEKGYARRVAFNRPTGTDKYYYDDQGEPQLHTPPTSGANNALWFKMIDSSGNVTFDGAPTNTLFIFRAPEVPDLKELRHYIAVDVNTNKELDPADLATPVTTLTNNGAPPAAVTTRLNTVFGQFSVPDPVNYPGLVAAKRTPLTVAGPTPLDINALPTDKKTLLKGGGAMGVYQASNLILNSTRKLTLDGDAGSVYVLYVTGGLVVQPGGLELKNVVPENVYWIVSGGVNITRGAELKGNVLAQTNIRLAPQAKLEGRALAKTGQVTLQGAVVAANKPQIIAPDGSQPRLVPVTQIQSINGTPASGTTPNAGSVNSYKQNWLQQADSTVYNLAMVVGDSPNRPEETSAGANNLVRLQENWDGKTISIKGSFIQQKRSELTTAPFSMIRSAGAAPVAGPTGGQLSLFGYTKNRYAAPPGTPSGTQPYYTPPTRQWGFDVGLLSQSPDLFAQKFSQDIGKTQNFYREVGRDDPWIQVLLCAKEPADPTDNNQRVGKSSTTYTRYALPDKERPNCNTVTKVNIDYPANP